MTPFNSEIIDNQYLAIRPLKRGGFGVVYSGWELFLNIPIAIKEIHYQLGLDEQSVASFSAEAQIVARLDHPGICRVYAHKRLPDGRIFMVMEFIDGGDIRRLEEWLSGQEKRIPADVLLYAIECVGRALHYAHELEDPITGQPLRIVHRDISPSNIMLTRRGAIKLIDFGIAKTLAQLAPATRGGIIKGRPQYMAPEQISTPQVIDARADIYSLAMVYLELLAGATPYGTGLEEYALIEKARKADYDLDAFFKAHWIPEPLQPTLRRALRPNRNDRFSDLGAFLDALKDYEESLGYHEALAQRTLRELTEAAFPVQNLAEEAAEARQQIERLRQAAEGPTMIFGTAPPMEQVIPPTPGRTPTPTSFTQGSMPVFALPPERRKKRTLLWISLLFLAILLGGGSVYVYMSYVQGRFIFFARKPQVPAETTARQTSATDTSRRVAVSTPSPLTTQSSADTTGLAKVSTEVAASQQESAAEDKTTSKKDVAKQPTKTQKSAKEPVVIPSPTPAFVPDARINIVSLRSGASVTVEQIGGSFSQTISSPATIEVKPGTYQICCRLPGVAPNCGHHTLKSGVSFTIGCE